MKMSTEGKSPEVQDSTAKIESIARLLHNDPNKKLPAIKKTPIWQRIAAEKVDLYEESKRYEFKHNLANYTKS